ncbi:hypothetical protein GQ457_07G005380 [Hibiscus cannabinus]
MSNATIQNDDREENSDKVQQNLIRDLDRFLRIQLATMEERLGRLEERSEQGSSHGSRRPRVPLRQNQDDYYRRQAPRNQGPRNRNRNRVDDNLNSIRMAIPPFQGKTDQEAYLEWEKKVELVFECHNYSENKKVKLAAIEFSDYAIIWWDQLTLSRRRNGERPVSTWDEMKTLMRKRFVPTHYHRDLFQRLQSLTQGNRSVEDYYKDMEIAMIHANVEEYRESTMARFLAGLNRDIAEKVELQHYVEIEDMILMAIKDTTFRSKDNVGTSKPSKPDEEPNKGKFEAMPNRARDIKCFKCLGRGHIASQCPNKRVMFLKDGGEIESEQDEEVESEVHTDHEDLEYAVDGEFLVVK